NIAEGRGSAEILSDMRARLDRWMKETDDPLLKGPIAPPPDAVYNDVDDVSPRNEILYIGPQKEKVTRTQLRKINREKRK
ncbi:MAG: hypothetical protein JSV03_03315, partial [Planctomycetota bacterium]